jgi:MFS transporter, DHA2 family, multidrug resistance protein
MTLAQPPPPFTPMPHRRKVFFGVILGAHLMGYDNTMVAIALPRMQGPMSATLDEITWLLAAYLIAVAITMPMIGQLANRFGRKRVYLVAAGGFAVTTILAGASDSLFELVAFRFLQGVFAAAFQPLSQAFVFEAYSLEERGEAMGWWTVGLTTGMITGPTIGGYITEFYSWQAAFYMSLPITVLSFVIVGIFAPSRPSTTPFRGFNVRGYVILITSLVALQAVLSRGERMDWFASPQVVIALFVSAVALYIYIVHTLTSSRPFIAVAIFRDRNFMISCVLFFVMGAHWLGVIALASPFLQTLAGYPVMTAGPVIATQAVANAISAFLVGRLVQYVAPSILLFVGAFMLAFSSTYFSFLAHDVEQGDAIIALVIGGIGFGFYFVPLAVIAFSTLPTHHINVATGFFALSRNFGSSIGASAVAVYLVRQTQVNHARLSENITLFSESIRHVPLPEAWNLANVPSLAVLNVEATRQASLLAYIDDFRWLTVMVVVTIPLVLFVRMPGKSMPAETSTP